MKRESMNQDLKTGHEKEIYTLVQNALDFCGSTLEVVKDYCFENGLEWREWEYVRFSAEMDYPDNVWD